jgi:hypothetical protein
MTTPDDPLQSPNPIDLQRALAFLVGWTRQDDAVELIWQDAVDDGRGFMLAAALATVFDRGQGYLPGWVRIPTPPGRRESRRGR